MLPAAFTVTHGMAKFVEEHEPDSRVQYLNQGSGWTADTCRICADSNTSRPKILRKRHPFPHKLRWTVSRSEQDWQNSSAEVDEKGVKGKEGSSW